MRKGLMFVAGSVFGLALVATCGTKASHSDGGLLTDAGRLVDDAGHAIGDLFGVDLGVKDAAAAPPMTGDCAMASVQTETNGSLTITSTTYFSEFDPPGYDPMLGATVTVTLCDYEYLGTGVDSLGAPACPSGYTCAQSGYTPPVAMLPCLTTSFARVGPGKIVVNCGYKQEYNYSATPANNFVAGQHAKKVYVSVQ